MKTFKIPMSGADLPSLVRKLRKDADDKLREFCKKQIIDKKLSTKNFNYDFDLTNSRAGGQKKSIQKLKDIVYKAVKKKVLYLDYVKDESMVGNGGINYVIIQLTSRYARVKAVSRLTHLASEHPDSKTLQRYCRYLNFKCIKNGIPLDISLCHSSEIHPADKEGYTKSIEERKEASVRVCIKASLMVKLSFYEFSDYQARASSPSPEVTSYEEYENLLIERGRDPAQGTPWKELLKRYKTVDLWRRRDFPRRGGMSYYPGMEKYYSPEKLFLILDEMQQVLISLSRKTSYDSTAFDIGSGETT